MKIHSPGKGYTATDVYGTTELKFEDGVAEFDGELPAGVRQYLRGAGYGIDGEATEPEPQPEPADPRDLSDGTLGTPLRDAAVNPRPEDFLAPSNAGQANPHGPEVVSPEIHASEGVRPVKAGDVHVDDTAAQESAEHAHLGLVLADGVSAPVEVETETLESMTVEGLRAHAREHDIALGGATRKAEIIAAISAAPTVETLADGATDEDGTPPEPEGDLEPDDGATTPES